MENIVDAFLVHSQRRNNNAMVEPFGDALQVTCEIVVRRIRRAIGRQVCSAISARVGDI